MAGFLDRSPPSLAIPTEVFFCCPLPIRASLARGWCEDWVISPSSLPFGPLPPCTLFRFLSIASTEEVCVGVGVCGRVTTGTAGDEPPTWAVSKASRSRVFSSNPMPSMILVVSRLALTCAGFGHLREVIEASLGSSC